MISLVHLCIFAIAHAAAPDTAPPLKINTGDLDLALDLGVQCLSSILDPTHENMPYFRFSVLPIPHMELNPSMSGGCMPGRGLYALLKAENVTGRPVNTKVVLAYRRALFQSYRTVRGIPENYQETGAATGECWIYNIGSGLRGLMALRQYRNDHEAQILFEASMSNLRRYFIDPGYNWQAFQQHFGLQGGGIGPQGGWPRASLQNANFDPFKIWPLIKYHQATGDREALALANEFATIAMACQFPADGSIAPYDHMFECVGEMNGLAEVALARKDKAMMERVRARYERVKKLYAQHLGWIPEDCKSDSDHGEVNNTAEMIETALRLGDWGWTSYYQDAERYLRAHLLPSQLIDTSFFPMVKVQTRADGYQDVAKRGKGAFGFPAPYGYDAVRNPYRNMNFPFDVLAGAVATLAESKANCHRFVDDVHRLNLLFDLEDSQLKVISPYHDGRTLRLTVKDGRPAAIHLSDWVMREQLSVECGGRPIPFTIEKDYLRIDHPPAGREIKIGMALKEYTTTERFNGREYQVVWRGDSAMKMTNPGCQYPFFASNE